MSKSKNARKVATPAVTAPAAPQAAQPVPATTTPAAAQPAAYYAVVAPKRPLSGTHFGNGNAYMHDQLCKLAAANGGQLSWQQIVQACVETNHRSFATYALKRLRVLVPVAAPATQPTA